MGVIILDTKVAFDHVWDEATQENSGQWELGRKVSYLAQRKMFVVVGGQSSQSHDIATKEFLRIVS